MRVLVASSPFWTDPESIHAALEDEWSKASFNEEFVVVHGASTHADFIAADWANTYNWYGAHNVREDPSWTVFGKNNNSHEMSGIDLCLAFVANDPVDTVERCREAGITVKEIHR